MRIDEFSAPADIDGVIDATERTRFSSLGFDIITVTTAPLPIRIDEFSSPSDIDGSFTTEERTRFLTFGFSKALDLEIVIGWSEKYRLNSYISLEQELESEISLEYRLNSYILDREQDD